MSQVEIRSVDGMPVACPPADVDAANAAAVGGQLAAAVMSDSRCLIVDLAATRYLDSAGIDMLFDLNERLRVRRKRLLLVVPPGSPIGRLLEITAVATTIAIHADVTDASRACGSDPTEAPPQPA
jgi:anti-anti-sigma factor